MNEEVKPTANPPAPTHSDALPAIAHSAPKGIGHKIHLLWDTLFEYCGLAPLGNHLWGEFPAAFKHATFLFGLCILAICLLWSKGVEKSSKIDELKKDKGFLQQSLASNSDLNKTLTSQLALKTASVEEDSRKIALLTQERDKAELKEQESRHALAQWILLATSHTTNTLLTEHMRMLSDALKDNTKQVTEAMKELEGGRPKFELSVNGTQLKEGLQPAVMHLDKERSIFCKVHNASKYTAEKVTIECLPYLDKTNIIADARWSTTRRFQQDTNRAIWSLMADNMIYGDGFFNATTFNITTNYSGIPFVSMFEVYSVGSQPHRYFVIFMP